MTTFKKDFPEIDEAVQRDMTNTVNKSVDYRQGVLDNRKRVREAIVKRIKHIEKHCKDKVIRYEQCLLLRDLLNEFKLFKESEIHDV